MHNKPVVPIYLRLFVPLAILGLIGVYLYGRAEIRSEMTRQRSAEVLHIGLGSAALTGEIAAITRDLHVLSGYSALREATEQATPTRLAHVGADFANFSEHQRRYDQVRWIDETGMERLRVDYFMGKAVIVAQEQLQNKGQRYYFTDSFKLKPGEVYVSPLDLNIEHDKVELPYKPMLRLATPVTDSRGVKRGIVILNYNGRELLDSFAGATGHVGSTGMLVNSEGYWLKGAKSEDEWGFMFNRPDLSLAVRSAAAWARIRSSDSGQELLADGLWTWQSIYPLLLDQKSSTGAAAAFEPSASALEGKQYVWKAASHVSVDALGAVERLVWRKLALVGVVLLAVFGLGSWKLTQAWRAAAAS